MGRSLRVFLFLITKEEINCVPGGHGDFSARKEGCLKQLFSFVQRLFLARIGRLPNAALQVLLFVIKIEKYGECFWGGQMGLLFDKKLEIKRGAGFLRLLQACVRKRIPQFLYIIYYN